MEKTSGKKRSGSDSEAAVLHDIRLALGSEPDLVLWRNNTGALRDVNGRVVRYGLCEGSSDLIGVLKVRDTGVIVALEIKRPGHKTDRVRAEKQRLFRELIRSMGGWAAQVESVEQAMSELERARVYYGFIQYRFS